MTLPFSEPDRRELVVTVRGLPKPQGSKTLARNRYTGQPIMLEGRDREQREQIQTWRQDVATATEARREEIGHEQIAGPVGVTIVFTMPRPAGHFRTVGGKVSTILKDTAPSWVDKRPDVDKLTRAVLDALTASGAYRTDAQVALLTAVKVYAAAPRTDALAGPGAVIRVSALPT